MLPYPRCVQSYKRVTPVAQKIRLTKAIQTGDPERVVDACRRAVYDWTEDGYWPDNWQVWQDALNEFTGPHHPVRLEDL